MARLKKRKDGRYQRKVTLSNGKQKFVYGKTIAEVNAAANALMNQDTAGLEVEITHWWASGQKFG